MLGYVLSSEVNCYLLFTNLSHYLFCQYLARALTAHGVIDAFLDALVFVLAALSDAVTDSQKPTQAALKQTETGTSVETLSVCAENAEDSTAMLSRSGRCALHAVPYMLLLVRKLVQRDSYIKSPITSSMTDLSDDLGVFQMHALLYKVLLSVGRALFPAFKCKLLRYLPSELQQEWIGIIGDLVCSLQVPLPPAVLTVSPPGQLLNPTQSQVYLMSVCPVPVLSYI